MVGYLNFSNSLIKDSHYDIEELTPKTKKSDGVICRICGKGIWIPANPDFEINHGFTCSNCGTHANFDFSDVIIE